MSYPPYEVKALRESIPQIQTNITNIENALNQVRIARGDIEPFQIALDRENQRLRETRLLITQCEERDRVFSQRANGKAEKNG